MINSLGSEVGHCLIQFQSINLSPSFTKRKRKNTLLSGFSFFFFHALLCYKNLPGHDRSLVSWSNLHDEAITPLSDVANRAATGVFRQLTQVVRLYVYEQS